MTALAVLATLLGGLFGVVTHGPTAPVCHVDKPCSAPSAHATLLFMKGTATKRAVTDAKGAYRIELAPGRWALRVQGARFGWRPQAVTVPRGRFARANVFVDTGIR